MQEVKDTSIVAPEPVATDSNATTPSNADGNQSTESNGDRKRKRHGGDDSRVRFGRGGKKRDMGRKEYLETGQVDRRARNDAERARRQAEGPDPKSVLPNAFAAEEIKAEDRRPKRKVAVLIGYSGTGYKGMQISTREKTIEGDLFTAFVKAGAISKANADDPKKSGLVRCARTDKGVHAAGNMISLKLIIEDDDIVERINTHLSPQIRVWGIERTINSFSCYQACDSRWYEYLIPSHAFLPPHPSSFLAKELEKNAEEAGDLEGYRSRQEEVKDFWAEVEETDIKPIINGLDEDTKQLVLKALYETDYTTYSGAWEASTADVDPAIKVAQPSDAPKPDMEETESAAIIVKDPALEKPAPAPAQDAPQPADDTATTTDPLADSAVSLPSKTDLDSAPSDNLTADQKTRLDAAIKSLKAAYNAAKRRYRIPSQRIARLQTALTQYVGTRNYHNYTVLKTFRDPSSKRTIRSFVVNETPIHINGTEWLSLKVHGQSFMMHQIRKMVGMASLLVRCGADAEKTMAESFGEERFSIPKVPGLGLLLERPVFDSYNELQAPKHGREKLDFGKWEERIQEFKNREIYQRIFSEEERDYTFHQFFNHVDNYRENHFLYVTSKGIEATKGPSPSAHKKGAKQAQLEIESDDETAGGVEDN